MHEYSNPTTNIHYKQVKWKMKVPFQNKILLKIAHDGFPTAYLLFSISHAFRCGYLFCTDSRYCMHAYNRP